MLDYSTRILLLFGILEYVWMNLHDAFELIPFGFEGVMAHRI